MPNTEAPRTDRLGVARLEVNMGWLFREQLTHDHGIDAQVEIVKDGQPTGDLIAIQIKSGTSFFSERGPDDLPPSWPILFTLDVGQFSGGRLGVGEEFVEYYVYCVVN